MKIRLFDFFCCFPFLTAFDLLAFFFLPANGVPQLLQKLAPSGFSVPQFVQNTAMAHSFLLLWISLQF